MAVITNYFTSGSGAPSGAPSGVPSGELAFYFRTSNSHLYVWNGSTWSDTTSGGGAWTLISDQVLGSAASSITFSSIAGSYKHLYLEVEARSSANTGGANIQAQFNGDTGANYYGALYGNYSGGSNSLFSVGTTSIPIGACAGGTTGNSAQAGSAGLWLPDYAGTTFWKTAHGDWSLFNGTGISAQTTGTASGEWANTAAITSIVLSLASGNFITGSRATLWGVS